MDVHDLYRGLHLKIPSISSLCGSIYLCIKLSKLIPSLGLPLHKHTDAHTTTRKHPEPVLPNLYLPITPPQHISPHLTLMQLAHIHPLLPRLRVTHHHRHSIRMVPGPASYPADHVRVVEIVILLAVREQLARQRQVWDLALRGGLAPVVFAAAFEAVQVAVEEAGV